jgi:hypothetical protein
MIAGKVVCYAIGLPWVSHKFHTEFTLVSCTKQLIGVTIVGNLLMKDFEGTKDSSLGQAGGRGRGIKRVRDNRV